MQEKTRQFDKFGSIFCKGIKDIQKNAAEVIFVYNTYFLSYVTERVEFSEKNFLFQTKKKKMFSFTSCLI